MMIKAKAKAKAKAEAEAEAEAEESIRGRVNYHQFWKIEHN
jgi:hypothetical protein